MTKYKTLFTLPPSDYTITDDEIHTTIPKQYKHLIHLQQTINFMVDENDQLHFQIPITSIN